MKNTVKNLIVLLLTLATTAHASLTTQAEGSGLMIWIFMGFFGLIIAFQLVPGLMLFTGMIKGLFIEQDDIHSKLAEKK